MNHIPGAPVKKFWTSKWFTEVIASFPPIIVMGISAYRFYADATTRDLALYSGVAALWLVVASIWKVTSTFLQEQSDRSGKDHRDLRAALHVLHAAVCDICKIDPSKRHERLRATFHRVVPPIDQPEHLEQIVNYIGGDSSGEGRKFSIRAGVTGKASRDCSPYVYHRVAGDNDQCKKELREAWGYTEKDLKTLSLDRMSAFAIPVLGSRKQTIGVIYFDSTDKALFKEKKRQAAIVTACGGLSQYITERYAA